MTFLDWTALPPIISVADFLARLAKERAATSSGQHSEATPGQAGTGKLIVADVRWDLFEGSQKSDYLAGHIPGAIFVDLEEDLTGAGVPEEGRHPFPSDDEFSEVLGRLGINFEDTVVCYCDKSPMAAARFALMLRLVGVNAALLDGGLAGYIRAAGENSLETGEHQLEETYFPWQPFVRLVSMDEVAHAIPTKGALLIDARAAERYEGSKEPIYERPGHIPTAVNVPYESLLNADGTFKSIDETRDIFERVGATKPRIIFSYCGSGVSAAVNMLAMDRAGFEHAYLYPGSYSQWSFDPAREVETGR